MERPEVYAFTDYRAFLKAFYDWKKSQNSEFSHAVFADRAGMKSRSHLRLIITNKRNLTTDMIPKFIKGLELNKSDGEAFETLVNFNQSTHLESKKAYWERFLKLRPQNKQSKKIQDEYVFLTRSAYPLLLILLRQPHALHDEEGLGHLTGLTTAQVREGMESLVNLGALKKVGEKFYVSSESFETSNDIPNIAIQTFHANMLKKAEKALGLPVGQREFQSVMMPVNEEELQYLKKRLRDFADEIDQMFSGVRPKSDRVYTLNLNLFPLTTNFVRGETTSEKPEDKDKKEQVS